jgi:hypothetical protein
MVFLRISKIRAKKAKSLFRQRHKRLLCIKRMMRSLQQLEQDLAGASGHGSPCKTSTRERAAAWSKNYHAGVIFAFLRKLLQALYGQLYHILIKL